MPAMIPAAWIHAAGLLVASLALGLPLLAPPRAGAAHFSVQEAVLRAKPAVALVVSEVSADVRVNCNGDRTRVAPSPFRETGTGWVIDARGYLITNGHVVQPAYTPPVELISSLTRRAVESACVPIMLARMGVAPGERPDLEERLKRRALETALPSAAARLDPAVFVVLSNGTRLRAEVKKYSPPVVGAEMSGRDLALLKIDATDLPVLPLGDSRNAQIGDPVHILGFPGVVLSHELLNQSAKVEASVTNGAISGFKQDVADNSVIQTDAPAAWGNSGGPAVNVHGEVTGVLTFVSLAPGPEGSIVQGFNFIIPSAAVRDFVRGTDVRLEGQSKFNNEWFAGLQAFFDQSYRRAARHFRAADRVQPNLPDVKRILAEAESRPTPIPWRWLTAVVTTASLGALGAVWARRVRRNRFRIAPAEVVRLLENAGEPPIILDVRSANAYARSPLRIPNAVHVAPQELKQGSTALKIEPDRTVIAYCT
jgi:S1-C subfamily serine protease